MNEEARGEGAVALAALDGPDAVSAELARDGYLADEGLATAIFLAVRLGRPLLLEGDAGVGKTEVAHALARRSGARLLRLQCYEGIDVHQALYEWDHARQLLHLRATEAAHRDGLDAVALEAELYDPRFLLRRPLLEAISATSGPPPVLLVDEVDRADDEFEAFLLEVLSSWTVSVPELGTVTATLRPIVVLTSNRTRELHDALKRRCLYHWLDHPEPARELAILRSRAPDVPTSVAVRVTELVNTLRGLALLKPPGVAEAIDWARALDELGEVDDAAVSATLGVVLKHREDLEDVRAHLAAG